MLNPVFNRFAAFNQVIIPVHEQKAITGGNDGDDDTIVVEDIVNG